MKFFQALLLLACAGRLDSLLSSTAAFVKRNKTLRNRCYSWSDKILKPFRRSFETKGFDSSATPTGVILPRDSSQRSLEEEKFPDEEYEDDTDFRRGDVTWGEMHPVIALCLGFRVRDGQVLQDETVEPLGWYGLSIVPDLSNLDEGHFASRMSADLPEDEGATDIVIETLAGLEMYQKMKASPDGEVQRRILLGKWLYVQGFFDDKFPSVKRFIPAHMTNRGSDDEDDDDEQD